MYLKDRIDRVIAARVEATHCPFFFSFVSFRFFCFFLSFLFPSSLHSTAHPDRSLSYRIVSYPTMYVPFFLSFFVGKKVGSDLADGMGCDGWVSEGGL